MFSSKLCRSITRLLRLALYTPTHGYEPTREAAMAAFAKSWRRERKAWTGRLAARFRTFQVCPKDSPAALGEARRRKLIDGIIAFGGGFHGYDVLLRRLQCRCRNQASPRPRS